MNCLINHVFFVKKWKVELNYEQIIKLIIGFQFNCCKKDCKMMAHLLCAYLNGVYFNLQIVDDKPHKNGFKHLRVEMFCSQHCPLAKTIK